MGESIKPKKEVTHSPDQTARLFFVLAVTDDASLIEVPVRRKNLPINVIGVATSSISGEAKFVLRTSLFSEFFICSMVYFPQSRAS